MKERQRRNIIVGVFVILGILLFIIAIYLIGQKEYIFGSPAKISAIFNDVKGLKEGDKVRMSGIDIGTVSGLEFTGNNQVLVTISIDKEQFSHIHKDSKVIIGSQGLMGAKVVKVLPGDVLGGTLAENDTLETIEQVEIDDIIREVNSVSEDIGIVSSELASITRKINRGDGVFGKLFTDTSITTALDKTLLNFAKITENFNIISEKISRGEGVVGKLFADTTLSSDMNTAGQNIDQIASNLSEITTMINSGEGVFSKLFTDTTLTSNLYYTSKNLQTTTENLMVLTAALNNDSSALNLLINDPSFADSLEIMIERLNIGIIEATEAAEAIQRSGIIKIGGKKKKE